MFMLAIVIASQAQFVKIHDFDDVNGKFPNGNLLSDGTYLYGMTREGGASGFHGCVFKIKHDGTGFAKLLDFDNTTNGRRAVGSLITDGTYLYGMTERGGANNLGTIFKIKPDGTGYTKLLDFDGATKGSYPLGSLVSDGTALYGMASVGGANNYGVIFRIMPDGTGFTKLLDFAYAPNGSNPRGTLLRIGTVLYGSATSGGTGSGTIFKVNTDGTGFVKLHNFSGTTGDGGNPEGSPVSDGTYLYGMISIGGGTGSIYRIKLDGTGYSQIFDFANTINGIHADLVTDSVYLYGMTSTDTTGSYGTIFKVKLDGTGYVKMKQFLGSGAGGDGRAPKGSLIFVGSVLYGMTESGGVNDDGIIFRFGGSPSGIKETSLGSTVNAYPNPANGKFIISGVSGDSELNIYNLLGKRVYYDPAFGQHTSQEIDLSASPRGVYLLRITNGAEVHQKQIVLQ